MTQERNDRGSRSGGEELTPSRARVEGFRRSAVPNPHLAQVFLALPAPGCGSGVIRDGEGPL